MVALNVVPQKIAAEPGYTDLSLIKEARRGLTGNRKPARLRRRYAPAAPDHLVGITDATSSMSTLMPSLASGRIRVS